ncbi:MAG: ABC transporter permease [Proteobacteria bacterium]|nr:ABC transporter permease [Pseudomonadota bacterium]MBI3496921.1 ABC transporter permease [Pseudomonadota bacterium]
MLRYATRRLIGLIPVLLAAIILTFAANQLIPGDPITIMLSDQSANKELADRLRAQYGLTLPVWQQFVNYILSILHGDFGLSFRFVGAHVVDVIWDGLMISPVLALAATALAVPTGVVVGIFAALRRNRRADTAVILALVAGISIPNFAMAAYLVYLFSVKLAVLPVAGWGRLDQAVLPVLVLALQPAAQIGRLSRTYMLEVLGQDYIRTARAKGLRERLVVYRHALRNTLVPLLTTIGIIFGTLLSASFVIETIFNIPGLGRLAIQSVFARDYPVTTAIVLLFTFFYTMVNLVVDLLYGLIDPRIRLGGGQS